MKKNCFNIFQIIICYIEIYVMNKLKKKNQNINMKKFYLIETSFIISININDDNSLIYNNFASYTFNNEYFFFFGK